VGSAAAQVSPALHQRGLLGADWPLISRRRPSTQERELKPPISKLDASFHPIRVGSVGEAWSKLPLHNKGADITG